MSAPAIPGFSIGAELGRGADAVVYRAQRSDGGQAVALKIIPLARLRDPDAHLRDAWAAGSTGHRGVVAVLEAGRHEDWAWVAMELADGDAAALARRCGGRLKPSTAARVVRDVALGLQALADHGYVHRDVKPSNILLRADGSAMIGDLAPIRGGGTSTRSADMVGTPAFLSPEQVRGAMPDVRSDIHALGATLVALIAGRPPFIVEQPLELLRAIATQPAPDLRVLAPDVPPAIAQVAATALDKDPARRQRRPAQLAAELDAALAGQAPSRPAAPAVVAAPPPAAARPSAPGWLPLAAAGVAAVLGMGIGAQLAAPSAARIAADADAAEAAARQLAQRQADAATAASALERRIDGLRLERDRLLTARHAAQAAVEAARPPAASAPAAPLTAPAPVAVAVAPEPARPAAPPPVTPVPPVAARAPSPAPAVAAPSVPAISAIAAWRIGWDLPGTEPEPPPATAAIDIRALPEGGAEGVSWSPVRPGALLTWNSRRIDLSLDMGRSWRPVSTCEDYTGSNSITGRAATWAGTSVFVPAADPRALGMLSSDGGLSWRRVPLPSGAGLAAKQASWFGRRVLLRDGRLAVIGRDNSDVQGIYVSADAGSTWQRERTLDDRFASLLPLSSGAGVICRRGQSLACSVDGGVSWAGVRGDMQSWFYVGEQSYGGAVHLLQSASAILRLSAAGADSVEIPKVPASEVRGFALEPADPRRILVGDARKGLLRTVDGGRSWQSLRWPIPDGVVAMDLIGRRSPRLAVLTRRSLVVIDLTAADPLFVPIGVDAATAAPSGAAAVVPPGNRTTGNDVSAACWQGRPERLLLWNVNQAWIPGEDGALTAYDTPVADSADFCQPTWDAAGRTMLLPSGRAHAWLWDAAAGTFSALPPPWGLSGRGVYALPPCLRPDGAIVAGWSTPDRRAGDGRTLRLCSTADRGRTWREERKVEQGAWIVADAAAPLLLSADSRGLVVGGDPARAALASIFTDSTYPACWAWCGGKVWAADALLAHLAWMDPAVRRWTTLQLAPPGPALLDSGGGWSMVVDPQDPRRVWVAAQPAGLIHTSDGGLSWNAIGGEVRLARRTRLTWIGGDHPSILAGGQGCAWRIDAGAAGEGLFTRICPPIP